MDEQLNSVNPDDTAERPQPAAEVPEGPQTAEAERTPDPEGENPLARAMAAKTAEDGAPVGGEEGGDSAGPFTSIQMPDGPVPVRQARFGPLEGSEASTRGSGNIELLLDVNLPVSIELGRTQMSISDILELGSGSIVELDKLAGEPVDILVNSRPLAKGEVVVLDENFGVRITSLVSPRERLERLNIA